MRRLREASRPRSGVDRGSDDVDSLVHAHRDAESIWSGLEPPCYGTSSRFFARRPRRGSRLEPPTCGASSRFPSGVFDALDGAVTAPVRYRAVVAYVGTAFQIGRAHV